MVEFDENGRLFLNHHCKTCSKFPLENMNDSCLSCGYSQAELIKLEANVNKANKALDLMSKFFDENDKGDIDVREGFLHLSGIKLGDGLDQIVFTDIDQTNDIRAMADLADHMVNIVVYPSNIKYIEGDIYFYDYEEDDED